MAVIMAGMHLGGVIIISAALILLATVEKHVAILGEG
jgi:hypothetical protein